MFNVCVSSHVHPGGDKTRPPSPHLIQVQHLVPPDSPGGLDVLHGQGEVDPSGVRQVKVIGVILVPLLHRSKHLLLVCTDDVHVLRGGGERERERANLQSMQSHLQIIYRLLQVCPLVIHIFCVLKYK